MASANVKNSCATCKKNSGVATCDGCQQSFCGKHFGEHRQELSQQIDNISQERDLLRRDLDQHNIDNSILSRINTWEQESIAKIQVAAEAARTNLKELFDKNRKELQKSVNRITDELQSCRESDDYTEIDINKWIQQLQAIRKMLESPSIICSDENETQKSVIRFIRVCDQQEHRSSSFSRQSLEQSVSVIEELNSSSNERFDGIIGDANISEEGLVCTSYADSIFPPSIIYGANRYSSGIYRIHFRIDKIEDSYSFFGITTFPAKMIRVYDRDISLYGWWDLLIPVVNGKTQRKWIKDNQTITTGDEMTLILDCDHRQIQLQHHRTDQLLQISVDLDNCPFPWKIIVKLQSEGDCVRILQ